MATGAVSASLLAAVAEAGVLAGERTWAAPTDATLREADRLLALLAGAWPAPGVLVQPVHHASPADRMKFDIVQSIRTRTLLQQGHPGKRLAARHGRWLFVRSG